MGVKGFEVEGIIKIDNVRVYGLNESIIASGYPMQTETYDMNKVVIGDKDLKRGKHLGNAVPGSGHDCFSKGITVQFDLQVPEYIWRQLDRYHFIDYVSSQSKMHRILKMDIDKACNKYVLQETIDSLNELIDYYNNFDREVEKHKEYFPNESPQYKLRDKALIEGTKENLFNMIIANTPSGIMLTARMTTNYLQLKSMYNQRKNHKMQEWRYFCEWVETLPMFKELVLKDK